MDVGLSLPRQRALLCEITHTVSVVRPGSAREVAWPFCIGASAMHGSVFCRDRTSMRRDDLLVPPLPERRLSPPHLEIIVIGPGLSISDVLVLQFRRESLERRSLAREIAQDGNSGTSSVVQRFGNAL